MSTLRDYGIVVFFLALFVGLSLGTDTFLTSSNLKNVVDGAVAMGLLACAGTLVIIAGGFDLSAGAIFAVSAIIGVEVSNSVSPVAGIAVGILVGCVLGLINGLLCTVGRINHFVGTLGTSIAYGGMATAISGSGLLLIEDPSFANVANTQVLGFNLSTWILVAVALFCAFLLNRTTFGRHTFGTGGNLVAARLSGVPVNRTLIATYVLSGGVAATAGLIVAARSLSVSATTGANIVFDALAAILIGGNSVLGGEGAIWRTIIGVFILALISNGFNLLGVDPLYQQIVNGTIILVAVGADAWVRRTHT
ncbi:MAG TPA: ABC transporter permease [Solirubrobacteraceae bacterium]|nr:ABC transporter permease [Solirubrobacteraceae bacterium]